MGCTNRHVEEKTLIKAYLMAWNVLVENREVFEDGTLAVMFLDGTETECKNEEE